MIKRKIFQEIESLFLPVLLGLVIVLITIPSGLYLYRSIPKQAICIYDSAFTQQIAPHKSSNVILDTLHLTQHQNDTTVAETKIYEKTGPIGDTFGGTVGPIIALFASFLTFLAFYIQYRANVLQRKDIKLERFESKYFELIELHKANVDEIDIAGVVKSRKSFVRMFNELSLCYGICSSYNDSSADSEKLDIISLTRIAYRIFFFGIGKNSEKQMSFKGNELVLFNKVKPFLEKIQEFFDDKKKMGTKEKGIDTSEQHRRNLFNEHQLAFKPFDGHVSILAHYYRHLFQTVKFVAGSEDFSEKEKLDYLRIIRAQLSNHEQLMLYYNGVSMADDVWFEKEYFTRYKMIHNIPLPLADFGITPEDHPKIKEWYKAGHTDLFEWE